MNPSANKTSSEDKVLSEAELGRAAERLTTAKLAGQDWASKSVPERLAVIKGFRHFVAEEGDRLAGFIAASTGRSKAEVLASEVIPMAEACRFLQNEAESILAPRKLGRRGRPQWLSGAISEIRREPCGTVLIIAPSNYPLFLAGVQVAQALTAGNSVLLKPGNGGLTAACALAEGLTFAGLPSGILQVLDENVECARAALQAGVDKVLFTGSAAVGAEVLSQTAHRAIPSVMELSGCDGVIIRSDADLGIAVEALRFGILLNQGRTCIAPKRVFVARSVATEFEGRLASALAEAPNVILGKATEDAAKPLVLQALHSGAHVLAGSLTPNGISAPLVLCGVPVGAALLREDLFAPIMSIVTVADDEEAVKLLNECPYGLGATVFTCDIVAAKRIAERLVCGVVTINDMIVPTADPRLPFGGRRKSGFGVTRGAEGLLELTSIKVITLRKGRSRPHFAPTSPTTEALFASYLEAAHGRGFQNRLRAFRKLLRFVWCIIQKTLS